MSCRETKETRETRETEEPSKEGTVMRSVARSFLLITLFCLIVWAAAQLRRLSEPRDHVNRTLPGRWSDRPWCKGGSIPLKNSSSSRLSLSTKRAVARPSVDTHPPSRWLHVGVLSRGCGCPQALCLLPGSALFEQGLEKGLQRRGNRVHDHGKRRCTVENVKETMMPRSRHEDGYRG